MPPSQRPEPGQTRPNEALLASRTPRSRTPGTDFAASRTQERSSVGMGSQRRLERPRALVANPATIRRQATASVSRFAGKVATSRPVDVHSTVPLFLSGPLEDTDGTYRGVPAGTSSSRTP